MNTGTGDTSAAPGEYRCPICEDKQWLRFEVSPDNPNFGRLIPCECLEKERRERDSRELAQMSNLAAFGNKTFGTFNPRLKGTRDAYKAARAYAHDPQGWMLLHGNCGVGKTHLAAAIANHCMNAHSMSVYFRVVPDLLDQLRATFDPESGLGYDERFTQIRNCQLLVLDDLGTENTTSWATEKLYQLINHRYNEQLPTVITTNQDFKAIDRRILSRILDTHLTQYIFISTEDFRLRTHTEH